MSTKQFYVDSLKALVERTLPGQPVYEENPTQQFAHVASVYMAGLEPESYIHLCIRSNAWASMTGSTNFFECAHDLYHVALQTYDSLLNDWCQDHISITSGHPHEDQLRDFAQKSALLVRNKRAERERRVKFAEEFPKLQAAAATRQGVEVDESWPASYRVVTARIFDSPEDALAYINTLPEKN